MCNGWDDEQLLTALSEAIKARQAVPSWFVETGKNAYAWHNIDAELAQLTYDSYDADKREAAVARSETASVQFLTFTSAHLTMELEVAVARCSARSSRRGAGRWRSIPGRARSSRPR